MDPVRFVLSFRYSSTQHLRPEETALGALNDLLIDRLRRVVHDHRSSLVIDFRVDTGISNEIDDPFLALVLGETEAG